MKPKTTKHQAASRCVWVINEDNEEELKVVWGSRVKVFNESGEVVCTKTVYPHNNPLMSKYALVSFEIERMIARGDELHRVPKHTIAKVLKGLKDNKS